ncbi:MAG: HAMP domain-containing histidine kinase [Anaeroplasmataceae bacterium]|nr:HAMP domain-containing histidine kinase [Anaeroplasmataceae bacterium]MDE6414502.1 HAMP domain-containing histidine kinase [Anaeroplasmataceae bacterium]
MKSKYGTLMGFLILFVTIAFNASLAVIVYSAIADKKDSVVAIVILIFILCSSLICATLDFIRRKLTVEAPVKEILEATKRMATGDFDIDLTIQHTNQLNPYDCIKMDLNTLAQELSKNEVLKTDFISNVSHEIKTPLSVIQNYTQALANPKLDEETKSKYLDTIQRSCKKLSNLITNILKLNKLENGTLIPEFKAFNLTESITEQIISFDQLLEEKELELICELDESITIESERSYLEIVWSNLLSNAIKFSNPNGQIKIILKQTDKNVIFTIEDTGCGMSPEEGKHIFDKFYQADTSHSKEGNGLGLSLVKKVIDLLGGIITVESEVGKGTKFSVILEGKRNA